jgi:acetyltransferase-like isoleucine patch superfamily enzyme
MRSINRDSLPHLTAVAADLVRGRAGTVVARAAATWWGVQLGDGCRFFGVPQFRRHPGSAIRIGDGCELRSAAWSNQVGLDRSCMISTLAEGAVVDIGPRSGLSGTVIGAAERVRIGSRVLCGANCTITDTDWHPVGSAQRSSGVAGAASPVTIEDDVWLCLDVTVLKGVTIGSETVVAAGSVVAHSLPPRVLAGGVPARVIRELR